MYIVWILYGSEGSKEQNASATHRHEAQSNPSWPLMQTNGYSTINKSNDFVNYIYNDHNLCICVTYACEFFPLGVTGLSIAFVQALSS